MTRYLYVDLRDLNSTYILPNVMLMVNFESGITVDAVGCQKKNGTLANFGPASRVT